MKTKKEKDLLKKKANNAVELSDEEVKDVNGGMKIVVIKSPKFFSPLLRLIFKVKKEQPKPDTVITGPVIAGDDDDGE